MEPERPQTTIWRMRVACWISKATHTHKYVIYISHFHSNNGYVNAPQCYFIRTLPVLFELRNNVSFQIFRYADHLHTCL